MTWTKDEFEKLYARFTESGLSIRDFCFNEGIPESRFYYWKKRVIQEPKYELQKADGSFLPVNVTQKDGKITMRNRTNPNHTQPPSGCLCEICYPNGVVVHITNESVIGKNSGGALLFCKHSATPILQMSRSIL